MHKQECVSCGDVRNVLDMVPIGHHVPLRLCAENTPIEGLKCGECVEAEKEFDARPLTWKHRDDEKEPPSQRGPNAKLLEIERLEQRVSMAVASGKITSFRALEIQAILDVQKRKAQALKFMLATGALAEEQKVWPDATPAQVAEYRRLAQTRPTFKKEHIGHSVRSARPASTPLSKFDYQQRGARQ